MTHSRAITNAIASTRLEGLDVSDAAVDLIEQAEQGVIDYDTAVEQIIDHHTRGLRRPVS